MSLSQDLTNATEVSSISLGNLDGASSVPPSSSGATDKTDTDHPVGQAKPTGTSSRMQNHELKVSKSERRVLKTLVVVTVGFFICWVGRSTLFFIYNIFTNVEVFNLVDDFVITLAFLNSVINPFIYVITLKEYRQNLFKKLTG